MNKFEIKYAEINKKFDNNPTDAERKALQTEFIQACFDEFNETVGSTFDENTITTIVINH